MTGNLYPEEFSDAADHRCLQKEYGGLAKFVAKTSGDAPLYDSIMKGYDGGSWIAIVQALVRSHKLAGEVTFRALHSLRNYAAAGLWQISVLKPELRRLEHLLRD